MNTTTNRTTSKKERARLSVDLDAYPDVKRMLIKAMRENRGVNRTWFVIEALRRDLKAQGYGLAKEAA